MADKMLADDALNLIILLFLCIVWDTQSLQCGWEVP